MEEQPETTHFRCEYHLQQNAKAAAKKDGVGEWEQIKRSRKSDKERGVFADAEDLTKAWRVSSSRGHRALSAQCDDVGEAQKLAGSYCGQG